VRYVVRAYVRMAEDGESVFEEVTAIGLDVARRTARLMYHGQAVGIFRVEGDGSWRWVENHPESDITPMLRRLR
jgi:hypothetical protein